MYLNYIIFLMCLIPVNSHIFMKYPPSRKSKYSKYYVDNNLVDYNIMAPLNTYGYKFPCKGFSKGPPTETFYSNTITVTLEGSAVHGGGHCQFGITYNDNEFLVLKTVIRSCLMNSMTYEFQLPQNTPQGPVTVFWTWINAIGNREYYMECADILLSNNENGDNQPLNGKELIIADINGYQIIPEFPRSGMYDGSELFLNARPFYIYPPQIPTITPTETHSVYLPTPLPILIPQPVHKESECTNMGEMKCDGNGFNTCIYDNWVFRECAPGTTCKQLENTIICDFFNRKK